ncbi:MAG: MFS transporter [Lentisphaerae bacterium]|jgi:fucose permease|nr:MFS transporter [Lentisphaerota bacterium]
MVFGRYDYAAFVSFFTYASGSVVVPVALVSLSRELGFSLESGGMGAGGALHLGRTIPIVVAMVLCGFAAGRWGKRRTFGCAVLLMGTGLALCALAPAYGVLMLALMTAGLGEGIVEGLATPFVQDLHPDSPGRYINFAHAFWSVGVLVTVLVSGVLLSLGVSWRLVMGGIATLALIPAGILLIPSGKGHAYPEHPEPLDWRTVSAHAKDILRRPRFWLFFTAMFVAGGGELALTFWSASYIRLSFNPAAWAGGVGTACFAAGMVIGRTGWGYLIKQSQLRYLLLGSSLVGAAITALFPVLTNLWLFYGLLLAAGIATAPFWPTIQSYCADRLPGTDTTMLFVLLSCAGIPGCGFFAWLMGYVGDRSGSLSHAFWLVPGCFLTVTVLIAVDWACAPLSADTYRIKERDETC